MTKRFTIEIIEDKDVFIHQDGAMHFLGVNGYVNGGMVIDLLNELNDENEQLKSDVYDWKVSAEDYLKLGKSLKKENEQLKQENETLAKGLTAYFESKTKR